MKMGRNPGPRAAQVRFTSPLSWMATVDGPISVACPGWRGHRAGVERIQVLLETLISFGVRFATIYAFSTENWGRPKTRLRG